MYLYIYIGAVASALATTTLRKNNINRFEADDEDAISQRQGTTTQLLSTPESSTEVCDGPRLCRTGKTGLVRSSSSFQVSRPHRNMDIVKDKQYFKCCTV